MKNIISEENLKVSDEALHSIAKFSEGSIRDSITILEQSLLSSDNESISTEDIDRTLGYAGNKLLLEIYLEILKGDNKSSIDKLNESFMRGEQIQI